MHYGRKTGDTFQLLLPDLVLQEAHITVEQGVRRRQDAYRLHPRPPLHRALHCHVGKAGEAKVAALPEVAVDGRQTKPWVMRSEGTARWLCLFFFLPGNSGFHYAVPGGRHWATSYTLTWSLCWLGENHWRWLWIPLLPGPCLWADTTPACFLSHPHNKEIIKTHTCQGHSKYAVFLSHFIPAANWILWKSLCVDWQLSKHGVIGQEKQRRWLSQCGF